MFRVPIYLGQLKERIKMTKYTIKYLSKSDGQVIEREFDPSAEDQREFVAKSSGNLCRVYFDVEKDGYRTATNDWIVSTS